MYYRVILYKDILHNHLKERPVYLSYNTMEIQYLIFKYFSVNLLLSIVPFKLRARYLA